MKLWALVFVFVASITAFRLEKRASSSFIGYRVVSPGEAKKINDNNKSLVQSNNQSPQQLGAGVYISDKFQDWFPNDSDPWDCAIFSADSEAWNMVNKAWMPESFTSSDGDACLKLWYTNGVANRVDYLKSLDASWTPSNTVLLSRISGFPDKSQLMIPPQLVSSLTFFLQCAARSDSANNAAISAYDDANWYTLANTKGTPQ